jgi:NADPH-dependent 2,4-dienoyl-CoA reductase/sulfur reductase-like enzyme
MTCVINPLVGREGEIKISPAQKKKKVYIGGAGPGGLEAAKYASQRGHDVTVFEKEPRPGGQMNLACAAPSKQEVASVVIYLYEQAVKAGAKINFNTELTLDLIMKDKPDAVIVATGARAVVPAIPGCECGNVYSAHDVLAGKADIQPGNVLITGGGLVGCETAEFLATTGDDITIGKTSVTLVEKLSEIGADMFVEKRILSMKKLRELGVNFICNAEVKEIFSDGISYIQSGEEKSIKGFDYIIFAMGAVPVNNLVSEIGDKIPEVIVIGDAKEARQALEAIAEGNEAGRMV